MVNTSFNLPMHNSPTAEPQSSPPSSPGKEHHTPEPEMEKVFPLPVLRLEISDLQHEAVPQLLEVSPNFNDMMQKVLRQLYTSPPSNTTPPTVDTITVIARNMDDVPAEVAAHSMSKDSKRVEKDVHMSLGYMATVPAPRRAVEITGVLVFMFVTCVQYDGHGTAPGGLTMGIADWVRLRCGLAPPHWRHSLAPTWDAGYSSTAFFLNHLERRFGDGTVRRMNEKLRTDSYDGDNFWIDLLGLPVAPLWDDYVQSVKANGNDVSVFDTKA